MTKVLLLLGIFGFASCAKLNNYLPPHEDKFSGAGRGHAPGIPEQNQQSQNVPLGSFNQQPQGSFGSERQAPGFTGTPTNVGYNQQPSNFNQQQGQTGPQLPFGSELHSGSQSLGFQHEAQTPQTGNFNHQPQTGPQASFGSQQQPGSQSPGFGQAPSSREYLPPGAQRPGGQFNGNNAGQSFGTSSGEERGQVGNNGGHATFQGSVGPVAQGPHADPSSTSGKNANINSTPDASTANGNNFNYNAQPSQDSVSTIPRPFNANYPTNGQSTHQPGQPTSINSAMYGQNHGNVPSANAPQGAQGSFGNGNNNSGASSATGKYFGAAAPVLPFEKANGQHGTEFSQTRNQIGETPAGNFGGSFNQMQQYASPFVHAKILRFDNNPHAGDGSYNYAYETDNGIAVQEEGFLRDGSQVAQGGYMYTAPDGQQYSVEYIADENGFQPKSAQWAGRDAILRSIQLNKEAEARGEHNEGSYHEEEGAEQKYQFGAHQNGAGFTRFSGDQNAPQSGFGPGASQQNGYQRGPLGSDQAGGTNANGNSYNYPQPNSVSSKAGQTFNGPQPTQHGAVTSLKDTQNGKNGYGAVQNSISSDKKPDQPSSGPQQLEPYDQSAQPQSGFAPQSQASFFPSQHQPGAPVGHQAPFQENGHQQAADLQQVDNNQFPPISKPAGGAPQQQLTSSDKQYDINGGYKY